MTLQVIHDHNITFVKFWNKHLFDIDTKHLRIHCTLKHKWRSCSLYAYSSNHGRSFSVTMGHTIINTPTTKPSAIKPCHCGFCSRFINKNKSCRVYAYRTCTPHFTGYNYISSVLSAAWRVFFIRCSNLT